MEPVGKEDETLENKRRRLIFRAGHRGTKEMDLILGSFAIQNVPTFSAEELAEFDHFLSNNDPDLYNWITGKEAAPEPLASSDIFQRIIAHKLV